MVALIDADWPALTEIDAEFWLLKLRHFGLRLLMLKYFDLQILKLKPSDY